MNQLPSLTQPSHPVWAGTVSTDGFTAILGVKG